MSKSDESVPEQWGDLDDEQREALLELADQKAGQRVNRRDVLAGGAGLLGLGGLLKSTGRARAAPSGNSISVGPNGEGTLKGGQVDLADTSSSPASAGQFRRNGSDVEVHSGGGVKNLSNIGSGGGIFEDADGDGTYEQTTGSGIQTGEINQTHYLDPDASDFGAELQSAVDTATDGDIIKVPPVAYTVSTEPVVNTNVVITSDQPHPRSSAPRNPLITAASGFSGWCIKGAENQRFAVKGLAFDSADSVTTTHAAGGIKARGQVLVNNVVGRSLGGPVVKLSQESSADNLNISRAVNISAAYCEGAAIHTENTSGTAIDINGCEFYVSEAFDQQNSWAINHESGIANEMHLQYVQGTSSVGSLGGIRINSNQNYVVVQNTESVGPPIEFASNGERNVARLNYNSTGNAIVDNGARNRWVDDSGQFREWHGAAFDFYRNGTHHVRLGTNPEIMQPGNGWTFTSPDGSVTKEFGLRNDGTFGEI